MKFIIKYFEAGKMSKQSIIQFSIFDQKSFKGREGNLSKISQKSSTGFKFFGQSQIFSLTLNFYKTAIVTKAQIKVKDVERIQLYTKYSQKLQKIKEYQLSIDQMKGKNFIIEFQKGQVLDNIQIRLCNLIQTESTIFYFLIKGIFDQTKTPKKFNNVSKNDDEFRLSKRSVGVREKQIFNDRKKTKQKSSQKKPVYINLQQNTQLQNLKKAIQLSKMQQVQKQKQSGKIIQNAKKQNDNFHSIEEFQDIVEFQQIEKYQKIPYDSNAQKIVEHVTQEWIQAQRNAQILLKVKKKHSLSDKVNVKFFKNWKFLINNIFSTQRTDLIKFIKFLGGQIIQQPTENCFIIANRKQGAKINLAKYMNGVKIIKPQYVKDCFKICLKLDYNDYKL